MNPIRQALFVSWLYGLTLGLGLLGAPFLLAPRDAELTLVRFWARLVAWGLNAFAGIRIEVRGIEHRPSGAALIAAKHGSILDIVAPFLFLPDPCLAAKQELLALPVFGWHASRMDLIPIDRGGHAKALKALVREARARIGRGRQLIIFPEGTRKRPGEAPDYKPGVAALYRDLAIDCTPLATNVAAHCSPTGTPLKPGTIVFEFLPPIPPGLPREAFMRELEHRIETASNTLFDAEI